MRHLAAAVVLTLCALPRLLGPKVPIVPARWRFKPMTAGNGASFAGGLPGVAAMAVVPVFQMFMFFSEPAQWK